jgi:hypothetical protein
MAWPRFRHGKQYYRPNCGNCANGNTELEDEETNQQKNQHHPAGANVAGSLIAFAGVLRSARS